MPKGVYPRVPGRFKGIPKRGNTCRHCCDALTAENWSGANRRFINKICNSCYRAYQMSHYRKHRERYCQNMQARHAAIRAEVLAAYGNACACCGETEEAFLALDHVHNDGKLD